MCSTKHKRWFEFTAKFDTQTRDNWISTLVAARLDQQPEQGSTRYYTTFSGETVESSQIMKNVKWAAGTDAQSRVSDFRLAPKAAPFEVLFGDDFINSADIVVFNPGNLILLKQKETKGEWLNVEIIQRGCDDEG